MQSDLNELISRGKETNRRVWYATYPTVLIKTLFDAEKWLDVILSCNFVKITGIISYECSSMVQFSMLETDCGYYDGIIKNNLTLSPAKNMLSNPLVNLT